MAKRLFEEARRSFVYGQYLASIVLGMSYIEHTLAGLLYAAGRSDLERSNISKLLGEAVELGWLTAVEVESLDHARTLRNSVAHFRRPLGEGTIEVRALAENEDPYALLEEDARHVIRAAFHILGRHIV